MPVLSGVVEVNHGDSAPWPRLEPGGSTHPDPPDREAAVFPVNTRHSCRSELGVAPECSAVPADISSAPAARANYNNDPTCGYFILESNALMLSQRSDTARAEIRKPFVGKFPAYEESRFLRSGIVWVHYIDRLCGLVLRVPGYTTEMYCASCEVRTEFIYVM
jgi:hypothetical protein